MTGRTHDLAAFTGLIIAFIAIPQLPEMSLATAITAFGANFIGGLFPDIDQPTSDFWDNFRLGPFVAKIVCPLFGGHRHISHSMVGLVLIGFGVHVVLNVLAKIVLIDMDIVWSAFMIGLVSHLVMDLFTREGLPLLWPVKVKIGVPPFKALRLVTGGLLETTVAFPALLLLSGYLIYQHQDTFLEFFHRYLS